MVWQKGQSGNPSGATERPFKSAIKRALKRMDDGDQGRSLELLAEKLMRISLDDMNDKQLAAIKEIADRLDGKPQQAIDAIVTTETLEERLARIQEEHDAG